MVKVTDVGHALVFDESDAVFSIKGKLEVTSPNGTEIWYVNEIRDITWTRTGSIANVKLEYSIDSGATYPGPQVIISTTGAAAETYPWTVPDEIGDELRVQITDTSNSSVIDESNANFEIKGVVTLTAPNGTETGANAWIVGDSKNITWTREGSVANVKLEYSTDGGTSYPGINEIIASTDASTGTYPWTVPDQ